MNHDVEMNILRQMRKVIEVLSEPITVPVPEHMRYLYPNRVAPLYMGRVECDR